MATISTKTFLICLTFSLSQFSTGFVINSIDGQQLLKFGYDIGIDIFENLDLIVPKNPEEDYYLRFIHRMEREIKHHISKVSQKIDTFQQQMDIRLDAIVAHLLNELPLQQRLDESLRKLDNLVGQINDLYNIFEMYLKQPSGYEKYTLEDFASTCVSSRSGAVPDLLKNIHRQFVPHSDSVISRSVLVLLANQMQESSSKICSEHQSLQQLLYNLYTSVTLAEIKGYAMIQFSYKLLRLYNQGTNFTEEMEMVKQQYAMRTLQSLRAVKTAMSFAPKEVWRCDPKVPKLDKTYTKLTQLFQGYIVNEVDLNRDGSCRETCSYYEYTKVHGCYKNQFCAQQRKCNGRVLKCDYIDSDMWICPASRGSERRYEFIEYENGRILGHKNKCSTTKVDSWWRWLFWHCSYCFCYCDDNTAESDRYFSLRSAVSDVENNKVVTGVRFKKANQVIHIQIQEGELMPGGTIKKQDNVQWTPIEEFSVLDSNVKNGVDYHTLSWEKRGLDLDDLALEKNYVLTGLRFRMVGPRLNLEVRMCQFNFTTGRLMNPLEKGLWISQDQTDRNELKLTKPDIPINSPLLALPDSDKDQYLNFAPSDRESDAAQNTIPFIDIQPVEPNPPIPLAGAGIFHKGRHGSGGYVALRLITYDMSQHLMVNLSSNAEAVLNIPNEAKIV